MRIVPYFAAILLLPVFFGAGTAAGAGHTESLVLGDFGGMTLDNMTLRPDGAAELASDPGNSTEVQLTGRVEDELCPAAAAGPDGTVYVAYRYFSATDDIYFLKLDPRLEPEGAAVGVCAGVPGNKDTPGIAVDSKGNCIVAWEDDREGLERTVVLARRLDPQGQLAGPEFRVSGSGHAGDPRVAFWPDGGFVIAWDEMRNQSSTYTDIYARNFKFDGTPDGPEILVCAGPSHQFTPVVAVLPSGRDFAVAWSDQDSAGAVCFRRLARNGTGAPWLPISSGAGAEGWPEMAVLADPAGRLAVTWLRSDGSDLCVVCARKFDFNGTPDGPEIQIGRSVWQRSAKTAAGPGGDLAVAWTEDFVYARHFSPDLVPVGDRVRLSQSNSTMIPPDIVPAGRSNYAVIWTDRRGMTNADLYGRFLLPAAVYRPSGVLDTGAVRPGPGFVRWGSVKAEATLEDPAANSVSLEWLLGDTWVPIPANGSLEAAGNASTVRLRVRLATTDNSSSPVLRRLTVNFVSNSAPSVTAPPNISMFLGDAINITAGGSDPDGDLLTFIWTPPEGPAPAETDQSHNVLWFRPAGTGQYRLTVRASDGLCESAPAPVVINVTERPVPPGCIIDSPKNGSAVSGLFEVSGRAVRGSRLIEAVEVRVDGGPWRPAVGVGNWSFRLDSRGLRNGPHTIEARARDGALSGGEAVIVIVRNPSTSVTIEQSPWWILALAIVIAVLYILVLNLTRRKVQGGEG